MDPALIDRIKRSYELFNGTGQFEPDFFHPEVEWHNAPELPGAGVHRGLDAVRADLAAQGEAWRSRRTTPSEIIPAGDKVVVFVEGRNTGKASGGHVHFANVHIWTLRDGLVTRIQAFLDRRAALLAAGLA